MAKRVTNDSKDQGSIELPSEIKHIGDLIQVAVTDPVKFSRYGRLKWGMSASYIAFQPKQELETASDWNTYEELAPSLVISTRGYVAAKLYGKIWNVGENGRMPATTEVLLAQELIDGEMFTAFSDRGDWLAVTNRAFDIFPESGWRELMTRRTDTLPPNCSLTFEYINRRHSIVSYTGYQGLVLIGAHDRKTLKPLAKEAIDDIAKDLKFARPDFYEVSSLEQANENITGAVNREGLLLHMADGTFWSMKTQWFIERQRELALVKREDVAQMIIDGTYLDRVSDADPIIQAGMKRHKVALELDAWRFDKWIKARARDYGPLSSEVEMHIMARESIFAPPLIRYMKEGETAELQHDLLITACKIYIDPSFDTTVSQTKFGDNSPRAVATGRITMDARNGVIGRPDGTANWLQNLMANDDVPDEDHEDDHDEDDGDDDFGLDMDLEDN